MISAGRVTGPGRRARLSGSPGGEAAAKASHPAMDSPRYPGSVCFLSGLKSTKSGAVGGCGPQTSRPPKPTVDTETKDMTTRRKTPNRLTMAALSLAAALALQTGPAVAQSVDHAQPVEDEVVDGRPDVDADGNWILCWPLHWLIYCLTR